MTIQLRYTISTILVLLASSLIIGYPDLVRGENDLLVTKKGESNTTHDEDDGVPIKKYFQAWMKERSMEQASYMKRSMVEEENEVYSDHGDIDLLDEYYNNPNRRLYTNSTKTQTDTKAGVYDVIIIGAGWAGVSAAMTLKAKGITNFKVLEAKDYIGGRSHTIYETFNGETIPIETGSMWLHSGVANPLYEIATTVGGIPISESPWTERLYKPNGGGAYTNQQLTSFYNQLFENGFMKYQAQKQDSTNTDQPLQTSATQYLNTLSTAEKKEVTKYFMRNYIELEYSGRMSQMSLWWWDMDLYVNGNTDDLFLPEGYSPLVEAYAAPIQDKVELEAKVTKINYKRKRVKVRYSKGGVLTTLATRKVIVTVPLGVLQAGSIRFIPQLPKSKMNQINRLGMGKMNKIFMFWDPSDIFWPSSIELLGESVERDVDFMFINPGLHNGGKPYLFAFFASTYAEQIESQSNYEDEISRLAMLGLRNMFGSSIPEPEKVVVTKWNTDEYTRGAYSFNKVGMAKLDRQKLKTPIRKKRLYISGEATNHRYFQTTHGAYWAGKEVAQKVANSL